MRELLRIAGELGYEVHVAPIDDDPELLGYCVPEERIIVLRLGLTRAQMRSTLAHELGHARYGHTCDSDANERQAYAYAAQLLIDPHRYADLEQISSDRHFLADELGVTTRIVDWYRRTCLTKLSGITYARPKMGAGQFAYRTEVA